MLPIRAKLFSLCIVLLSCFSATADEKPPMLRLTGDWQVEAVVPEDVDGAKEHKAILDVSPPTMVTVHAEKYDSLPLFDPNGPVWHRGVILQGIAAQECGHPGMLVPDSLEVRAGEGADAKRFEIGKDYAADLDWGTLGRIAGGGIAENQPVYIDYRHALSRLDSIVLTADGRIELRRGEPANATPLPPALNEGERRLANVWLNGRIEKLGPEHLFPVLETSYPEPPKRSPTAAEQYLPKTLAKLRNGEPLHILAWGDSVTACGYLPGGDSWQTRFVALLKERFPKANIRLTTEAWGGRNTTNYLNEPSGSVHNYQEKVLAVRPDLIVSEFVNDAGLSPEQVEERYGKLLADFQNIGAEWIILTPHYIRPDWMGLASQREVDADPRPYVAGLRAFASKHSVALADASLRWGRLWRQGIPYNTLNVNAINHPDGRGMKIFADSLMTLFP